MIPLFIPSYSRPNAVLLERTKDVSNVTVFVRKEQLAEYDEVRTYKNSNMKIVTLKNVENIGQTRAKMVNYARSKGINKFFMFDDDISRLDYVLREPGYNRKSKIVGHNTLRQNFSFNDDVFLVAESLWDNLDRPTALLGFIQRPFMRGGEKPSSIMYNNRKIIQAVGINLELIPEHINYRDTLEVGNEDLFFQYQLMDAGLNTYMLQSMSYDCPSVGSQKGGCNTDELEDLKARYEIYIERFMEACGYDKRVSSNTTPSGLPTIKFNWTDWR